ncbi:MAG: hypothetical protein IIW07_06800 [Clostridia bacterium]|nr:hypothetical protein [Clostridia bacterium]
MKKQPIRRLLRFLPLSLALVLGAALPTGASISEKEMKAIRTGSCQTVFAQETEAGGETELLPAAEGLAIETLSREALQGLSVYPGGMPFGIKFYTEGVTVVGFCDVETSSGRVNPAADAGLRQKDVILRVNGEELMGANELTERIEASEGRELVLDCRRGKESLRVRLRPAYCPAEGRYKTGIWVRDSGAGIGTVTFILPDTGAFGGLGHGVCDADTGALVAMRRGNVMDVTISSVVKGAAGAPGELKGYFRAGKAGALLGNSACGVWGVFSEIPEVEREAIPVGMRDDLCEGEAHILCTLDDNAIGEYAVRISSIRRDATGAKCFTVTVTDPKLLARIEFIKILSCNLTCIFKASIRNRSSCIGCKFLNRC